MTPRRALLIGAAASLAACAPDRAHARAGELAQIEGRLKGRLGVSAIDRGSGRQLTYRADERFAMARHSSRRSPAPCSRRSTRGDLAPDRMLAYGEADLLGYAPAARAHLSEGAMSIAACCEAIIEVSDNTAANLLLAQIGGPAGLTAFLRKIGDPLARLDRTEPDLNANLPNDPRDTTTPNAMRATMAKLLLGDVLSPISRERLAGWMVMAKTGLTRLRSALPADWRAGDKTGAGGNGAANDVAIFWPPKRAPILIAVYTSQTDSAAWDAAFADIARLVIEAFA